MEAGVSRWARREGGPPVLSLLECFHPGQPLNPPPSPSPLALFGSMFTPGCGGSSDSESGLNSSVNVCAAEYDGADKGSETKPDVVFLRAAGRSWLLS